MKNFAVVGTNFISDAFMDEIALYSDYKVIGILGSSPEKARLFANRYQIKKVYTSIEEIAFDRAVDAVYIASPNQNHYPMARTLINAHKAVLLEKPFTITLEEANDLVGLAAMNNTLIMENMRVYYDPAFFVIREQIKRIGKIKNFTLRMEKQSSRYSKYLHHEYISTFDPKKGNAAILDLGVYLIAATIELFSNPINITGQSFFLENGMEKNGFMTVKYEDYMGTLFYSKVADNFQSSVIEGEKGTIYITDIANPTQVTVVLNEKKAEMVFSRPQINYMNYTLPTFLKALERSEFSSSLVEKTSFCMGVVDFLIKHNGIKFN
ncbi:MAG TPA: Gfo/Idh/MocA family oxidoreductase [Bacilli bacterium]|nr:Gfo/Idh/MocA family oxidoreductase [Bacilli bacterium]